MVRVTINFWGDTYAWMQVEIEKGVFGNNSLAVKRMIRFWRNGHRTIKRLEKENYYLRRLADGKTS